MKPLFLFIFIFTALFSSEYEDYLVNPEKQTNPYFKRIQGLFGYNKYI